MTREEIDTMWSIATRKSIEENQPYTRYEFAKMVAELQKEACAQACDDAPEPDGFDLAERIRAMETI
jgi:hypothetical protein